jgi:hypothetical protein
MKHFFRVISFFLLLTISCSDDNNNNNANSNCNKQAQVISDITFEDIITANYMITNVVLDGDCLAVTVSSSGCSGDTWEMKLLGSNSVLQILPIQRSAKIELNNQEACLAIVQKTVSFDLVPFQIDGQNEVLINIEGWDEPITYEY